MTAKDHHDVTAGGVNDGKCGTVVDSVARTGPIFWRLLADDTAH